MPETAPTGARIAHSPRDSDGGHGLSKGIVHLYSAEHLTAPCCPTGIMSLFMQRQGYSRERDWPIENVVPDLPEHIDLAQVEVVLQSKEGLT
jgi:hypothetical protein